MSLKEAIKEMKNELEEEEKKEESETTEETEKEPSEEKEENPDDAEENADSPSENKPEEKVKEEKKEEPKKEESKTEESPDSVAFQRLRREAAAFKKRAEEAEAREAARINAPKAEAQEERDEMDQPTADPEIAEIVQSHRMTKAEEEFKNLEANFSKSNPEYEDISKEFTLALAQSIKLQNPRLSTDAIVKKTKETLLIKAANYMKEGFDPIEEMFHEAKSLGFTGKSMRLEEPKQETEEKEEIKPDMAKVAKNRAKSAGMAASSGKSEGLMTKAHAALNLTNEEWMRLPKSEKARILSA